MKFNCVAAANAFLQFDWKYLWPNFVWLPRDHPFSHSFHISMEIINHYVNTSIFHKSLRGALIDGLVRFRQAAAAPHTQAHSNTPYSYQQPVMHDMLM